MEEINYIELSKLNEENYKNNLYCYENTYEYEQEIRQTLLKEDYIIINVYVSREDYPQIQSNVSLKFIRSAAQGYWITFLTEVRDKLQMDFIDSIYDKYDLSPIHTTLRLKDGGHYVVRQREESSVLEVIQSGIRPGKIVWPITKDINSSKQMLNELAENHPTMEVRVDRLINKPLVRARQRIICSLLLKAQFPDEVLKIVYELVKVKEITNDMPQEMKTEVINENNQKLDPELDIFTIYRLSLECLNRIALKGLMEEVGNDNIVDYILNTLVEYRTNVDITIIGMKLLNDIVKSLTRRVDSIFQVIMDSIQYYSPPPKVGYPRIIKRLEPSKEEIERKQKEEEERRLLEMKLKEEQDLLELDAKIIAKENKVNELFQENITTKILLPKSNVVTLSKKQLKAQKNMKNRRERGDTLLNNGNQGLQNNYNYNFSTINQTINEDNNNNNNSNNNSNNRNDQNDRNNNGPQRSHRLPIAQVVNVSWNHSSSSNSSSSSNFHHTFPQKGNQSNGTTNLPPISTWKGPKTSLRPLRSLRVAEPPKKTNVWATFLSGDNNSSFNFLSETNPDLSNSALFANLSGVKFSGINDGSKSNIALMQCIITATQLIFSHYSNREIAYNLYVHEELCQIGLICNYLPRIVSYILWCIDKLMIDRIEEAENRVQMQMNRKKNQSTINDDSESNLSVGSNYEKKNQSNEVLKQILQLTLPTENILLFFAMCCHVTELSDSDKSMALKWINKWDDKSRSYQNIRNRGREIANMS